MEHKQYQVWVKTYSQGWIGLGQPKSHKEAHAEMRFLRSKKFLFKTEVRQHDG